MENKSIIIGYTEPPSIEDIEETARVIIEDLPTGMKKYIGRLKIEVSEFPDSYTEQELELKTPFDILGYYESAGPAAIGHLSVCAESRDRLHLFRRPILDVWCENYEDLTSLINRVILQEIGNHFGFTDDEVEMYEEEMLRTDVFELI